VQIDTPSTETQEPVHTKVSLSSCPDGYAWHAVGDDDSDDANTFNFECAPVSENFIIIGQDNGGPRMLGPVHSLD
jgi:hypothetical protein